MNDSRRALIVVDVQGEYFDAEGPLAVQYPPREESLAAVLDAVDAAVRSEMLVVTVRHEYPEGAPVFAAGSDGAKLHPEVEQRVAGYSGRAQLTKTFGSVFAGTDLGDLLRSHGVETITLVGYMTNNCILASAAAAEPLGFAVEVLRDATGAIHLSNEAGSASARLVHETLMVLLHSNFAAVATTKEWTAAVDGGLALPKSDLGTSAVRGRGEHPDS
jgi:nicotinamidase-related amidase